MLRRATAFSSTLLAVALLPGMPLHAAETAQQLAARHHCLACHAVDEARAGPAFAEVADRYAGQPDFLPRLRERLKSGGAGVWGSTPMPAEDLSDAELDRLITWIVNDRATPTPP